MPGMNGGEAAQTIREAERGRRGGDGKEIHTPIIALTAGVMEKIATSRRADGKPAGKPDPRKVEADALNILGVVATAEEDYPAVLALALAALLVSLAVPAAAAEG